jgi:hypothetical protein
MDLFRGTLRVATYGTLCDGAGHAAGQNPVG